MATAREAKNAKKKTITLIHPGGGKWSTTDREEATNLEARGYKVVTGNSTGPSGHQSTEKPAGKTADESTSK